MAIKRKASPPAPPSGASAPLTRRSIPARHLSPLRLVSTEPALHELIAYLEQKRTLILNSPSERHTLTFSRADLTRARKAFSRMIRHGEESLHRLCELICDTYLSQYQIQSVAIGELESTKKRFTFTEALKSSELYSTTDLDLGNRQLSRLRYFDGRGWSKAALVANVVEYQPTEPNELSIHRVISRIKAEEEIWNKVTDEIFRLDELVEKDKKLKKLSWYVKDVFGLKLVVGAAKDAQALQRSLGELHWSTETLRRHQVESGIGCQQLTFLEVKDYLNSRGRKRSGWQAIKSVVRWHGKTFEIQIQPLRNFLHEREQLTTESHSGFKAQREQVRDEIAKQIPLFGFYRDLLQWLFADGYGKPPTFKGIRVEVLE